MSRKDGKTFAAGVDEGHHGGFVGSRFERERAVMGRSSGGAGGERCGGRGGDGGAGTFDVFGRACGTGGCGERRTRCGRVVCFGAIGESLLSRIFFAALVAIVERGFVAVVAV